MAVVHEHAHAVQWKYSPVAAEYGCHDDEFMGILCHLYAYYFGLDERYLINWARASDLEVEPFSELYKKSTKSAKPMPKSLEAVMI